MVKSIVKSTKSHMYIQSTLSTNITNLSNCTRSSTYKKVKQPQAVEIETNSLHLEPIKASVPLMTVLSTCETASAK